MYQLCRVYPTCYLCKRTLYSLALGSHIVKLLTILLALCETCVLRDAHCPASALLYCLAIVWGLILGRLGPLTVLNQKRNGIPTIRIACAVPGVPDRWEARSSILLLDYLPALPTTPGTPLPHTLPYHTAILYIVNTLTMYSSLCCVVCCSLSRSLVGSLCLCLASLPVLSWSCVRLREWMYQQCRVYHCGSSPG